MALHSVRPASSVQKRLWFLNQLDPGSPVYNLPWLIRITGKLDIPVLERSLQAVAERHESLRTTFEAFDGQPAQVIQAIAPPVPLPVTTLEEVPEDKRHAQAVAIATEEARRPFDLKSGPLLRGKILRYSEHDHFIVLTLHHIVADGWSLGVLFDELGEFYEAFNSGSTLELPGLAAQYSDFATWQQEHFEGDVLDREVRFWKGALDGAPELFDLPADRPRPPVQTHNGRLHRTKLDSHFTAELKRISSAARVTPFMTLLAAFETLLGRYSGIDDFVLGIPVAGRSEVEWERLIGLFVNTLPLRADLTGNPTFSELLQRVRLACLNAFEHQDVPLDKVVEELHLERSLSYTPLFQVMFLMQNMPRHALKLPGMHLESIEFDQGSAKFDLTLEIIEDEGALFCTWEYSTDLFSHERIMRMADHYETLLRAVLSGPHRKLSQLPILTGSEQKQLMDWNATQADYPGETCIHEAFEQRAEEHPDQTAVISPERTITFAELDGEANALAHYLQKQGVQPGARVGVFVERSVDAIVAFLAVLKSGASYVPIDPAYPKERVSFMLEDCKAALLITQYRLREQLPEFRGAIAYIDHHRSEILAQSHQKPAASVRSVDPAYIMYTSGSTGTPKGVIAAHRACMNRFAWMWNTYPFEAGEVCAQRTGLSFVDSIWEIFGPLLKGVSLSIVPDLTVKDPEQLGRHLAAHKITRIVVVPALLDSLLESCRESRIELPHLRICISSGEALPYALYERFHAALPHVALVNLYGSSEVAADVTCFDTARTRPDGIIPLGKPISNVHIYLLDKYRNPVPVGMPGEIYVGGDCVALGYLHRPDLTAERFLTVSPGDGPPERLYKTGDLGRYREDGNIEFLGRTDRQIKVRGVRIEPGEIESLLASHPMVQKALVVASAAGSDARDRTLAAYVEPRAGQAIVVSELRSFLKTRLPEPMMPSALIALQSIPMTPNGKVDVQALPARDPSGSDLEKEYVPPRTAVEKTLAAIWSEVLGVERVGVHDNFFELGGHSLMAVRVLARVRKTLRTDIALRTAFEEPTLEGLALAIEKAGAASLVSRAQTSMDGTGVPSPERQSLVRSQKTPIEPWSALVELQPRGRRRPLFLLPGSGGDPIAYTSLPPLLDSDQPVYGLQSPGLDGNQKTLEQIEEIADLFVAGIRTAQPAGPYQLAGFCFGGIVAFEVAQRLVAMGEEVSLLALIETWPPSCFPVEPPPESRFAALAHAARRHLGIIFSLPSRQAIEYFREKTASWKGRLLHKDDHRELVMRANHRAAAQYVLSNYPGRILLFVPSEDDAAINNEDPRLVWANYAGKGSEVIRITGNRGNLLNRPHVQVLASKLTEQLNKLQTRPALAG